MILSDQSVTLLVNRKQASIILMGDKDVLIDILLRLPPKSLLMSKCVCKWWYHVISDPIFVFEYSRRNPQLHVSGFFLQKFLFLELYSKLEFFTYGGEFDAAPQPSLSFIEDDKGVCIKHSCNGLLLCSSFRCIEDDREYYICKPTTKQYQLLPKPDCKTVYGINIAYDPTISPHYKVVCICDSKSSLNLLDINIYDSATGSWGVSENIQVVSDDLLFDRGVYWNGALHWVGRGDLSLRLDIKQELLHAMPMPPIPEGLSQRRLAYFGETGGHLYLIETHGPLTTSFDVLEMHRDYSSWFVKYRVDIGDLAISLPSMVRMIAPHNHRNMFSVLHIVDRQLEDKDESFLVLHVPGNFVTYSLKNGTLMEPPGGISCKIKCAEEGLGLWYSWEGVYPYVNTLCYL